MAARRKVPIKKIKFELTRSSIAGIGVVCFCIFLWMFLLGVWAGQSLLMPSVTIRKTVAQETRNPTGKAPLIIEAEMKKKLHK